MSDQVQPLTAQFERNAKTFKGGLTAWREWLVGLQERLCRDLVAIALANHECLGRDALVWVNECIDNYWSVRRIGFKNWAALCCDWADPVGWTAPGWLLSEVPDETLRHHSQATPLAETLDGRLFPPYTEVILTQIALLIEMRILTARTTVLDDARIKIASEPAAKQFEPSASSVERINEAVYAIGRRYGDEWDRKWLESARSLYTELHPKPVEHALDSGEIVKSKVKRGPQAKMEFHSEVAMVVASSGLGANWKDSSNLEKIVKELDKRRIPSLPVWANRRPPARTWRRAVDHYPNLVRKAIEYSLKMARKI